MELQTIFYRQCAVTISFCRCTKIPLLHTGRLSAYHFKTNDTGKLCLATILRCKENSPKTSCIFLDQKKLAYIIAVPWLDGSSGATIIVLVKHVDTSDSSRLALQSPVFTICTTSLTFNNSTFCPHSIFMCFVWIWAQTAIISLYSHNWLVL